MGCSAHWDVLNVRKIILQICTRLTEPTRVTTMASKNSCVKVWGSVNFSPPVVTAIALNALQGGPTIFRELSGRTVLKTVTSSPGSTTEGASWVNDIEKMEWQMWVSKSKIPPLMTRTTAAAGNRQIQHEHWLSALCFESLQHWHISLFVFPFPFIGPLISSVVPSKALRMFTGRKMNDMVFYYYVTHIWPLPPRARQLLVLVPSLRVTQKWNCITVPKIEFCFLQMFKMLSPVTKFVYILKQYSHFAIRIF